MADTLFLAVSYLDRYLSLRVVPRARLQLVGVTCMLLAAKYEEIYAPQVPACAPAAACLLQCVWSMGVALLHTAVMYIHHGCRPPQLSESLGQRRGVLPRRVWWHATCLTF